MMKVEIGKRYQTRSGLPARVYAMDGFGNYPIHGAVLTDFGWEICEWTETGCATPEGSPDLLDLVEIPPEPTYRPFLTEELPRIVGRRVTPKHGRTGLLTVMITYSDGPYVGNDCYKMTNDDICSHWQFLDFDDSGNEVVTPCGVRVEL